MPLIWWVHLLRSFGVWTAQLRKSALRMALCISHTPWYCSIDQEVISDRPRGPDPTEMNPALFVYSGQIAQWTVCGLEGHNQTFSMQIRPLSVSKLSVAFMSFLLWANQVPFCTWTTCISYSRRFPVCKSWLHQGDRRHDAALSVLLACSETVLTFDYSSNMA